MLLNWQSFQSCDLAKLISDQDAAPEKETSPHPKRGAVDEDPPEHNGELIICSLHVIFHFLL